jgi:hypothetical protein
MPPVRNQATKIPSDPELKILEGDAPLTPIEEKLIAKGYSPRSTEGPFGSKTWEWVPPEKQFNWEHVVMLLGILGFVLAFTKLP